MRRFSTDSPTSASRPAAARRPARPPGDAAGPEPTRPEPTIRLFALTLFVSAGLLFCVQPMVARLVLPTLGGSPAVWNTCQVFFQAALLGGYLYAHALTSRLALAWQWRIHGGLLVLAFLVLPIGVETARAAGPAPESSPVAWLLTTLLTTIGLPFFVVASTAPLVQRWFAETDARGSANPYVLYAASNLGSMIALIGYPLVIEPCIALQAQTRLWTLGYGILALLIGLTGAIALSRTSAGRPARALDVPTAPPIAPTRWARWVGLAFVPSSLMLGVTSYLTTDLASVPLLWVGPLALYLLTFIIVFAERPWISSDFATKCLPPALLLLAWNQAAGAEPRPALLVLHLATFFLVALVCHGALAADRPPARQLTGFYLAMSVGGVLGGLFNALAAPLLFNRIVEYPLVLGLACLALPRGEATRPARSAMLAAATGAALAVVVTGRLLAAGVLLGGGWAAAGSWLTRLAGAGAAGLGFLAFRQKPAALAAVVLALAFIGFLPAPGDGQVIWRDRDFFGVLTVTRNDGGRDHRLVHGRTLHGRQNLDPATADQPVSYYYRTGPVADIFARLNAIRPVGRSVGVVGLGAGSTAAYARHGDRWTFYEIDPAVVRVASDPRYFTYLSHCQASALAIVTGDARLRLREAADQSFDLLMLDAFSSDAIPVHLMTREALSLYRRKLAPGGFLAVHISNRYLDLAPVLATLARSEGMACRVRVDLAITPAEEAEGKTASIWAVLGATEGDLGALATDPRWLVPAPGRASTVWTDDSTDIVLRLLGWR